MAAKRTALDPLSVSSKVNEAFAEIDRTQDLNTRDPRNYREGYWALIDLFERYVSLDEPISIRAGATATYGWMPRIIRTVDMAGVGAHLETLKALRAAPSAAEAFAIIVGLPEPDREAVLHLVDGSLVGTSKFLHFLNPEAVPVWDRRVARNFNIPVSGVVSMIDYLGFWKGMSGAVFDPAPQNLVRFCAHGPRLASDLRVREYALFLVGAPS